MGSTTTTASSTWAARVHRSTVFAVLATAVVVDQATKGWAWRHAPDPRINFGGNAFVGDWTAPGSVRGAVDFIPLGRIYHNVADVFIAAGTLLFLIALGGPAMNRSAQSWTQLPHQGFRSRGWIAAVAVAVCLLGLVGFGAVTYGGVTEPARPAGSTSHP